MSARRGFICSNAAQAGVTTSYNNAQGILLDGTGTLDAGATSLPGAAYLSHIEVQGDQTGATVGTISFFLTWDAAGNYPVSGESAAVTCVNGLTDVSRRGFAMGLDVWIQSTDRQETPGGLYLWCKTNNGTVTIEEARIFWAIRRSG